MLFQKTIAFFSVLAISYGVAAQTKQPNIIFLLADDLGYGDVACYGQQKIATPNIDKLAKEGMQCNQFYSGSAVCAPARASFMTGLHQGNAAVRGNVSYKPEGQTPLPDTSITFTQLLQKNGYRTGAFGKWSLGFIGTSGEPAKKGIDVFYGYNCQSLAHNYYPDHLWDNTTKLEFPENPEKHSNYSADLIHSKALAFIETQGKQPFFLYLPYTLPHGDLSIPHDSIYEYYVKKFNEAPKLKPANFKAKDGTWFEPYPHAAFAAMVARLDKYVGEINALLKKKGIEENTLFIFTSDNGPHREDGGDPDFFNSSGNLKGIKRDLYEGGIREPFIAKWKGHIKAGSSSAYPFAMWDMFPSFLSLAGVQNNNHIDGISIMPLLLNKPQAEHPYLYWELAEGVPKQAVRWGNWKAVRMSKTLLADTPVELYDLQKDPLEKINVAAEHKDIASKMQQMMNDAHHYNTNWPLLTTEVKQ